MSREVTSKSIEGIADLVVCAPIKRGFIDAFENVTYATRLRLATEAFHAMRTTAREYEPIKPFADVAERIQSLLAFRIGILDTGGRPSLFLAATFDRAWEPYIRLIWNPLGTFLDVLLCNCEGYVSAYDHSFADYARWVRAHQVDSAIFYATSPLTVTDQAYLIKLEALQRAGGPDGDDLALAGLRVDEPARLAERVLDSTTQAAFARSTGMTPSSAELDIQKQFLTLAGEALVVLYRLADYYPPDRPDGDGRYLRRAAQALFEGWKTQSVLHLPPAIRGRFASMFDWLETPEPPPPPGPDDPLLDQSQIQGGVLTGHDPPVGLIRHGCLLMFSVTDAAQARAFIGCLRKDIAWEGDEAPQGDLGAFLTLSITHKGLGRLGVPAAVIGAFPKEFRDGMEARATQMGDIGQSHPRNWTPPKRFTAVPLDFSPRVELDEIDFILQLRTHAGDGRFVDLPGSEEDLARSLDPPTETTHPLAKATLRLARAGAASGASLIAVQALRRMTGPGDGAEHVRDHFGVADLVSQPTLDGGPNVSPRDVVRAGELLLGYANDRGDPPGVADPFLLDGTFMVIRKIRQDLDAFNAVLETPTGANPLLKGPDLLAKMLGRHPDGDPPLQPGLHGPNDFDFSTDPDGAIVPLQSHIRRANPRAEVLGLPPPRLMRRGMSYGPNVAEAPHATDRGLVFMAYCASLAEQFETVQRWINGGNSTWIAAAQNDPLIGTHSGNGPKTFRFIEGREVGRVDIERPFVALEWGLYLFIPSRQALKDLAEGSPVPETLGDAQRGEAIIQTLAALPEGDGRLAWKTYLEDFTAKDPGERAHTPDIWAAIRERHGGVLRTPQGVLAASDELVNAVYMDPDERYSVGGQAERMRHSFGEIFIGLDPGEQYSRESAGTNAAILAVGRAEAFAVAHKAAGTVLARLRQAVGQISDAMLTPYPAEFDLRRDFIAPTLALICKAWFGLPDLPGEDELKADPVARERFVQAGDWSFVAPKDRLPRCPGDYMAPSRYCFYPDPTETIIAYGQAHGQALHTAAMAYLEGLRPGGASTTPPPASESRPPGPLTQALMAAIPDDNDLLARTLIGTMTGALPPIDGNLRAILYEWLKEKTLWRFQRTLFSAPPAPGALLDWAAAHLEAPMKAAMQKRPAPDLLWRTVLKPHRLGDVDLEKGDRVILSVVSATLEKQNAGDDDVAAVFGGRRQMEPHPVHACPAYDMAMGTMLGVLTALLRAGEIQALPQPFLVRLVAPGLP
jgi:Dyp-type peroxidase family